jgi:transposase
LKQQARQQADWLLLDEDESWFSRFEQPRLRAWSEGDVTVTRREPVEREPDKALACYGAVRQDTQQVYLYFTPTRPVSEETWRFVHGLIAVARQEGKRVLVLIWDNAGWHLSQRLRQWIREHNRAAKRSGDVRILTHRLPLKSPWLNPIEPRWVHAKRAICEPHGPLSVPETKRRLCAHFDTQSLNPSLPNVH